MIADKKPGASFIFQDDAPGEEYVAPAAEHTCTEADADADNKTPFFDCCASDDDTKPYPCSDAPAVTPIDTDNIADPAPLEDHCTELWTTADPTDLGSVQALACVRYEATIGRLFNTTDAVNDMVLGHTSYNVRVRFGPTALAADNANYQFADQAVDFDYFNAPELTEAAIAGMSYSPLQVAGFLLLFAYAFIRK